MSEHRFRELDQAWERSQAYERSMTLPLPTDYTKLTWSRGAHGTITITFLSTGDCYYWFCGKWHLSVLTRARNQVLARADELEAAIKKACQRKETYE